MMGHNRGDYFEDNSSLMSLVPESGIVAVKPEVCTPVYFAGRP